jgi:hypothetical protein
MKKIEMNKGNWSGETGTVRIYANGGIKINGERFPVKVSDDGRKATVEGSGVTALLMDDGYWYATTEMGSVVREEKDLYKAIAKVLFNII